MRKLLREINEIENLCQDTERLLIFGAGRTCYSILQYLTEKGVSLQNIFCIAVSNKIYNLDAVMGVPVCLIDDIALDDVDGVLVTVFEKKQEEVFEQLEERGFSTIYAVSNLLYAKLRQETKNLSIDILTNTQWIRDDIRRLHSEMRIKQVGLEKQANVFAGKVDGLQQPLSRISILENQIRSLQNQNDKLLNKLNRMNHTAMQQGGWYYEEILSPQFYEGYLKNWFLEATGKQLNLDNPQTFNEKIQWIKLHGITPLMTRLADKYAVREWIAEKIGEEYLIPLLGVYDRFDDIDFGKLPEQFVLKCTHGCGWNEIVTDKETVNTYWMKKKFDRWMDTNFAFVAGLELQYRDITPRIIAEKNICEPDGRTPNDYKFFVFNGRVEFIQVHMDRFKNHTRSMYTREWEFLNACIIQPPDDSAMIEKPGKLDEMMEIAENLGAGFSHVRVDLYYVDEKIYFGEMTFTHASGAGRFYPEEFGLKMGEFIELTMSE